MTGVTSASVSRASLLARYARAALIDSSVDSSVSVFVFMVVCLGGLDSKLLVEDGFDFVG